jgi:hypothetical protein
MKKWPELLDEQGDWPFINPAHLIAIALVGNKDATRGLRVTTISGEVTTANTGSVAQLRSMAFQKAGLNDEGQGQPARRPASPGRS